MARLFYGDGIFVNLSGQNQRGKTTKKIIREHKTPKKLPSRPPSFLPTLPTQPDHLQEFRKIRNNNKNTLQKPIQKNRAIIKHNVKYLFYGKKNRVTQYPPQPPLGGAWPPPRGYIM